MRSFIISLSDVGLLITQSWRVISLSWTALNEWRLLPHHAVLYAQWPTDWQTTWSTSHLCSASRQLLTEWNEKMSTYLGKTVQNIILKLIFFANISYKPSVVLCGVLLFHIISRCWMWLSHRGGWSILRRWLSTLARLSHRRWAEWWTRIEPTVSWCLSTDTLLKLKVRKETHARQKLRKEGNWKLWTKTQDVFELVKQVVHFKVWH